jgi:hypothetical protein
MKLDGRALMVGTSQPRLHKPTPLAGAPLELEGTMTPGARSTSEAAISTAKQLLPTAASAPKPTPLTLHSKLYGGSVAATALMRDSTCTEMHAPPISSAFRCASACRPLSLRASSQALLIEPTSETTTCSGSM